MANHASALKRMRQSRKRRIYNRQYKNRIKEAVKSVQEAENYETALENLNKATKILDKSSARNIIHKNTAARKKSNLAKHVNTLKGNVEE